MLTFELPDGGRPSLQGLTGTIRFGAEGAVPPDDIRTSDDVARHPAVSGSTRDEVFIIPDGFEYTLLNLAVVDNRLLADFDTSERYRAFCEARTPIWELPSGAFSCTPTEDGELPGEVRWEPDPAGGDGAWVTGPDGGEVWLSYAALELCRLRACRCSEDACAVDLTEGDLSLDLTVDAAHGALLGTSDLGRIEAVRQ